MVSKAKFRNRLLLLAFGTVIPLLMFVAGLWLFEREVYDKSSLSNPFTILNEQKSSNEEPAKWFAKTHYKRIVYVFVDALGFSWIYQNSTFHPDRTRHPHHYDAIDFFKKQLQNEPNSSVLFRVQVEPPPSTSIKTKHLMQGNYAPSYALASPYVFAATHVDSIPGQMKAAKMHSIYVGDYLLEQNFPGLWTETELWGEHQKRDIHIDEEYTEKFMVHFEQKKFDFIELHFGGMDRTHHYYGVDTDLQGTRMTQINQSLYRILQGLDNDTLLVANSDHGCEHPNGEHYSCKEWETCSSFLFLYTRPGLKARELFAHKYPEFFASDPLGRGVSENRFAATLSLALNIPLPFQNVGTPHWDIMQVDSEDEFIYLLADGHYVVLSQVVIGAEELYKNQAPIDPQALSNLRQESESVLQRLRTILQQGRENFNRQQALEASREAQKYLVGYSDLLRKVYNYNVPLMTCALLLLVSVIIYSIYFFGINLSQFFPLQFLRGNATIDSGFSIKLSALATVAITLSFGCFFPIQAVDSLPQQISYLSSAVRLLFTLIYLQCLQKAMVVSVSPKRAFQVTAFYLAAIATETTLKYIVFSTKHNEEAHEYILLPKFADILATRPLLLYLPIFALAAATSHVFRTIFKQLKDETSPFLYILYALYIIDLIVISFFYNDIQDFNSTNDDLRNSLAKANYSIFVLGLIILHCVLRGRRLPSKLTSTGRLTLITLNYVYLLIFVQYRITAPPAYLAYFILIICLFWSMRFLSLERSFQTYATLAVLTYYFWELMGYNPDPNALDTAVAFLGFPSYQPIVAFFLSVLNLGGWLLLYNFIVFFYAHLGTETVSINLSTPGSAVQELLFSEQDAPRGLWRDYLKSNLYYQFFTVFFIAWTLFTLIYGDHYERAIRASSWVLLCDTILMVFISSLVLIYWISSSDISNDIHQENRKEQNSNNEKPKYQKFSGERDRNDEETAKQTVSIEL